ncbi:MAG: 30S ribosomal protein S2 [Planctomycetes bacterium]|nr:30S ribosomal protein S2 [Planctomycetota bacterium]
MSVTELLESGVHFGHRASRWNPKMRPFIHGKRNSIHIIDLKETVKGLLRACHFVKETAAEGGKVLIVGTKRSAREAVRAVAQRTGMPYVTERWLGGTLTNFRTIRSRLDRLQELDDLEAKGVVAAWSKKMQARHHLEKSKILKNLEGLRSLEDLPAALIVVDPGNEHIAVSEANKTGTPCVALLDTDCDPDLVDIAIPGNDDAMRSVQLILSRLGDALEQGFKGWQMKAAELEKVEAERRKAEEAKRAELDRRRQVEQDWQKKLKAEADARKARAATEAALQALEHEAGSRDEGVTRPIEDEPEAKAKDAAAPAAEGGDDKAKATPAKGGDAAPKA